VDLDDITHATISEAIRIHRELGRGLLESVYETVLAASLARRGLHIARQQIISFEFDGILFEDLLRVDLIVEHCVLVELKSVEKLAPVHSRQLLTYLRLTGHSVGLLINFGAPSLKEGLRRIVHRLTPPASSHLRVNQRSPEGPFQ
jgi:GxxExxY protein